MESLTLYNTGRKPVEIRREMVNVPAVMAALDNVEKAVFVASTAKTVEEYSPQELAGELKTALKWIAKDVGWRETSEADWQYLVIRTTEILRRYYPTLTLKDFRLAFEMSITGELDEFLPKGRDGRADRGHYQQFNAEYVCKILDAYKSRRGWVLKRAREAMPKETSPANEGQRREHYERETRRNLVAAYREFEKTGEMPKLSIVSEMLFCGVLADVGYMEPGTLSEIEQESILRHFIASYAAAGNTGAVKRLKEQGTEAEEVRFEAGVKARKKALKETFSRMREHGVKIEDYIKFE